MAGVPKASRKMAELKTVEGMRATGRSRRRHAPQRRRYDSFSAYRRLRGVGERPAVDRGGRLGVGGGEPVQQLLAQRRDGGAGLARILGDVGALHRAQLGRVLQRAGARHGLGEQRFSGFSVSQRW